MIDTEKTLAWLNDLCSLAIEESRKGNTRPASLLGSDPSTQYYFHSVHCLRTITPQQWALTFPEQLADIDRQRVFQEQAAQALEAAGKIKLLEDQNTDLVAKIDALSAKLDSLIAAQAPKPRKPKAAPVETEGEGEQPAATDGEGADEKAE